MGASILDPRLMTVEPTNPWTRSTRLSIAGSPPMRSPKLCAEKLMSLVSSESASTILARMSLTMRPVLMLTGHFTEHMPSAAHVSSTR